MNKIKKNTKKAIQNEVFLNKINLLMYITVIAMIIICPLIIRVYNINYISPFINTRFLYSGEISDTINYTKFIFLVIGTLILVFSSILKLLVTKNNLIESKYNYIIFGLISLIIISTFFSPYKSIALFGNNNRFEGAIAYLCYFFVFLSILNIKMTTRQRYILIFSATPFLLINNILGLLNFYNYNILDVSWIKELIVANSGSILSEGSHISSTLPNPNYISGAGGFMFSLYFSIMLFEKNMKLKVLSLVLSISSVILCLTSLAKSGAVVIFMMFPIILIVGLILKRGEWKLNTILSSILIVFSLIGFLSLVTHNKKVWNESIGVFIKKNPFDHTIAITKVTDQKGNNTENNLLNKFELPKLHKAGYGSLSGRVYIWEQGFNAWKQRPWFGYGLETYGYDINQYEIHKAENLKKEGVFIDKPHNLYLGWLLGTGIFTFLAFIIFLGMIGFDYIKIVFKKSENVMLISLGFMMIGYCAQGIINDSSNGTSVIFWILLAMLVREMVSEKNKKIVGNN
ncbi:MAG: O-Antigen ligase family protein [Haloplasmataceae bacterium]|jgi:hypothetical protein|nr:O-Antigen ligase family protein [Haloplasmataceae bacterium]